MKISNLPYAVLGLALLPSEPSPPCGYVHPYMPSANCFNVTLSWNYSCRFQHCYRFFLFALHLQKKGGFIEHTYPYCVRGIPGWHGVGLSTLSYRCSREKVSRATPNGALSGLFYCPGNPDGQNGSSATATWLQLSPVIKSAVLPDTLCSLSLPWIPLKLQPSNLWTGWNQIAAKPLLSPCPAQSSACLGQGIGIRI